MPHTGLPAREMPTGLTRRTVLSVAALSGLAPWQAALAASPTVATPLHRFGGPDGRLPTAQLLVASNGQAYGTTNSGGTSKTGTIYRVAPDGSFSVLYSFDATMKLRLGSREQLYSTLSEGAAGVMYGVAGAGGKRDAGTLFSITPEGVYTKLHGFQEQSAEDGSLPLGPPRLAPDGNLYGATRDGGEHNWGTVYRLSPAGQYSIVRSFDIDGGAGPGYLIVGQDGALYGSLTEGPGNQGDFGAVFRLTLDGQFSILHVWPENRREGGWPAELQQGPDGALYGSSLGANTGPDGNYQGIVFRLALDGDYRIVHGFVTGGRGGTQPNPALAMDADGVMYGCTIDGGRFNLGTAFSLKADGTFQLLHTFGGSAYPQAGNPWGGLALAADGSLLGTLPGSEASHNPQGAVFRLTRR